ncbi:MAG: VOC family protein, partial [Nakamurella sp.]
PADAANSDSEAEDWLIFRTPPTELGVHPTAPGTAPTADPVTTIHLMCDDIAATVADLKAKGVLFVNDITDRGFGLGTELQLPGGSQLGLYQPKHAVAYNL